MSSLPLVLPLLGGRILQQHTMEGQAGCHGSGRKADGLYQ